jgi:16S rRNA (uracil1498-N3)-methyltransferase
MKQSLKYHLPKINNPITFTELINNDNDYAKYIAHCQQTKKIALKNISSNKKYLIAIGPEGDFSSKEIKQAINQNYNAIDLGKSRLRTETAGIVATHTINLINL